MSDQIPKQPIANQPSPEAIRAMIRFMMKTSMPRIIAEELAKKREEKEVN